MNRRELMALAAAAGAGASLGPLAPRGLAATTGSYNDGVDEVPGGLSGDPERVIIVGAGWAGLSVANALRNAGIDYVLVEARGRVGGRARTVDIGDVPIDLGCSWIHGPIGNPMTQFAEQAGVTWRSGNIEHDIPVIRFYDALRDTELNLVEKPLPFTHALTFAANDSGAIADELGPRASVRDGAQVYLDRNGVQGDERRHTEFVIKLLSEFTYCNDWSRLSLRAWSWTSHEDGYQGLGQGELPDGGYRGLYNAMAGPTEVRLRHRVRAVEVTPRGVIVRAQTRRRRVTLRGSHVVVAVPLGVLKHGGIRFEPGLPATKRDVIKRMGFGPLEKVAMVFDKPFWSDTTHTHILFESDRGLEFPMWLDLNRTNGFPAIVAFGGGPFAKGLRRLDGDARLALALNRFSEILGRPVPQPRAFKTTDWQNDPWTRGAYSTTLVGGTVEDHDTLAEPVNGRLLFAGEATHRRRRSTADGAMSSGVREAKRLLQRNAVTLSAG